MAANRTVTSLSIALIVFVMLTFVLAIMVYVVFGQRLDQEKRADEAVAETAKTRTELNAAIDEKRKLQELIGVAAEKTAAEIETETAEWLAKDFAGFNEDPKTLRKLVSWLADAIVAKDGQMDKLRQDGDKSVAEKVAALAAEKTSTSQKETERERLEKELADLKKQFNADRAGFQEKQDQLTKEHQKALGEVTNFERLRSEVEKFKPVLPAAYREFETRKEYDPKRAFEAQQEPEGKLSVVSKVLKDLRLTVRSQNDLLAKLNASDPAVQKAVITAAPKDELIERFDGQVLSVNESDRSAVLSFTSTAGLRPGLLMDVYDRSETRPLVGSGKGVIEVLAVDGPTRARGRIRSDSTRAPILAGDGLASGLWSPGGEMEVVIVGYVQIDGDRDPDLGELVSRIENFGGRVVDAVSPATSLVVDAGLPKTIAGDTKPPPGWSVDQEKTEKIRRKNQLEAAKGLGIKTVTVGGLLDMLGVNRGEIETGSLPRRGLQQTASPR
jgi:hypothetical protein